VTTSRISPAVRNRLAFWALAGLALFVAHDAVFLAQIGPGQSLVAELRTAGHEYWSSASVLLIAVAVVAGVATWLRMRHLRRRASSLGASPASDRPLGLRFLSAWWRFAVLVAVAFTVQENVEHVIVHGHVPIAGALLGPEYPLALPVIGFITAIASALAAVVARTHEALVAAIEAALRQPTRAPRLGVRPPARLSSRIGSVLARRGAGRAPPALGFVVIT
jgi:hypothetical protein